jgi:hypothetical protein
VVGKRRRGTALICGAYTIVFIPINGITAGNDRIRQLQKVRTIRQRRTLRVAVSVQMLNENRLMAYPDAVKLTI